LENLCVARLSFRLLYTYKQFCSRFGALVEHVPDLKQLLKDVFHEAITAINLGFIVYICDAHKMLYFCNQNGIVTFVKVVY